MNCLAPKILRVHLTEKRQEGKLANRIWKNILYGTKHLCHVMKIFKYVRRLPTQKNQELFADSENI